jgi:hypothetical protein
MEHVLCPEGIGMKRRRWRHRCRIPLAMVLAATVAHGACAEESPTTTQTPAAMFEGRPVVAELPMDVKRLIDAVRRLQEEPGLILDREAIYKTLEVRPTSGTGSRSTDGSKGMGEQLEFEWPQEMPNWKASLSYSEYPRSGTWAVRVELSYSHGPNCYPSRLVEAYWGKPFVFQPVGVHGPFHAGPHDGEPYPAEFHALHRNSANVIIWNGRGGCLSSIKASNLFELKEYSDDRIYHE